MDNQTVPIARQIVGDISNPTSTAPIALSEMRSAPAVPPCQHEACLIPNYNEISDSFRSMDKSERLQVVRAMLFATTAPRGAHNELGVNSLSRWKAQKGKRRLNEDVSQRSAVMYTCRGRRICRSAFAKLVCLDDQTVQRHADKVANTESFVSYETRHAIARTGKHGLQRLVVKGFLTTFGLDNGLECPRGRGSREEAPLRLLPSTFTKADVHEKYVDSWSKLIGAAIGFFQTTTTPTTPLSYNLFIRYWESDFSTLRIAKSGSDFCDLCTALKNDLAMLDEADERYTCSKTLLEQHRRDTQEEFLLYRSCQSNVATNPTGNKRHLVFYFAEKVLLPKLRNQPGQLHFVTGLKFDIFGISSSNAGINYVYGLPEGHWPNEKTAKFGVSMLHHLLELQRTSNLPGSNAMHLQLHADNCAGQNKNRFILWYLCWRALCGLDDEIDLFFLIAGHTKNVCDGAFGHVKRNLNTRDARCPADMMTIIEQSSSTTSCIPSAHVTWRLWKNLLSRFFQIPSSFMISKYQVFSFKKSNPGILYARRLSTSTDVKTFSLLSGKKKAAAMAHNWMAELASDAFVSKIEPLELTPSAHHNNRKRYLEVNILERYYRSDYRLAKAYFSDGTETQ